MAVIVWSFSQLGSEVDLGLGSSLVARFSLVYLLDAKGQPLMSLVESREKVFSAQILIAPPCGGTQTRNGTRPRLIQFTDLYPSF